jgi:uncharacterized protein
MKRPLGLALLAALLVLPAAAAQDPPAKKKALLVWGGLEDHEPKACTDIFAAYLREKGFEVEVANTLDVYLDAAKLAAVDLIVHNLTMADITPGQEKGLREAVQTGAGLAGWHGGLGDAHRGKPEFAFMVGGQFVAHPGDIVDYDVHILPGNDPVTKGLADFKVRSEQYYMHVDPGVKVLATTTFSGKGAPWVKGVVMPAAWRKRFGRGRVFYCSVGHKAADFDAPELKELVGRGLLWAARDRKGGEADEAEKAEAVAPADKKAARKARRAARKDQ